MYSNRIRQCLQTPWHSLYDIFEAKYIFLFSEHTAQGIQPIPLFSVQQWLDVSWWPHRKVINVESLCSTPGTDLLYTNYTNFNILSSDLVEQWAPGTGFLSTTDSHHIFRAYASYSTELYFCWLITPHFSLPAKWAYSYFRDVKKSNLCPGDGGQGWLHNHMSVFHTTELSVYLKWGGWWILCYG